MNIVVTGASGFVGRSIAEQLSSEGHSITGVYNQNKPKTNKFKVIQENLINPKQLENILKDKDAIIHCAGKVQDIGEWNDFYSSNTLASVNLIEKSIEQNIPKFIYISSQTVYGIRPFDQILYQESDKIEICTKNWAKYTKSKQLAELEISKRKNKINLCILRPGIIYGKNDPHFTSRYIEFSKKGVVIGDGTNPLNLIHVDGLSNLIKEMINHPINSGEIYNVADENNMSQEEFCQTVRNEIGLDKPILKLPYKLMFTLAYCVENTYKIFSNNTPPISRYGVYIVANKNKLDTSKVQKEFNHVLNPTKDQISDTIRSYTKNI